MEKKDAGKVLGGILRGVADGTKGVLDGAKGVVDGAKKAVQDVRLPRVKLPEIKIPGITKNAGKPAEAPAPAGIQSLSVQSAMKIIYYMMAVDGVIYHNEEEKFIDIGKELDPNFDTVKDQIVSACREQMNKLIDPEDQYAVLQDGVEDAVSAGANADGAVIAPKVLVWDLLTIAYSDGSYDENERKLLKYIVRKFNIDKAFLRELESSFLALMDLEKELTWIKTTDRPYLTIEAMVNEISDRKTAIIDAVKDLITL